VIQSFADDTTERVWNREKAPRLGAEIQRAAQKKLRQLNAADNINDLRIPPGTGWRSLSATALDSIRSGSTTSTESALCGPSKGLLT
jgi:plasmid maintenance system killer protein